MTLPNGYWSVAELVDLLKSKDYDQRQLQAHFDAYKAAWVQSAPAAYSAWAADFYDMQQRYAAARTYAQHAIDLAAFAFETPDSLIDANAQFMSVLGALKQVAGTVSKGDFDDLDTRLRLASGTATDYSAEPQPTPGSDFEFEEYVAADDVAAIADKAKALTSKLPAWVLPAVAVSLGLFVVAKVKEIL